MIYGYVRVSRPSQSLERQFINILREYPNAIIKSEKVTGTSMEIRVQFQKLLKIVDNGDVIVFDSVSRMSRNAEEGFKVYEELYNKGVELVFLKETYINTSIYKQAISNNVELTNTLIDSVIIGFNQYLMNLAKEQIKIAFLQSEKEVKDIQQRTIEGLKLARARGKILGRPVGTKVETDKSKECKRQMLKHSKKFGGSLNDKECMQLVGIAKATFYKYIKTLGED